MAHLRRRTVVALTALLTVAAGLPGTPAQAAPPPTAAPA
ncbi:AraC family transcriptional regulator, partial [Micromonospora aurantiaca]|nr:AraC family transcriptional regulator [Micromonospora aurantiaca]